MRSKSPGIVQIDPYSTVLFLEVPAQSIVTMQALFESYEGLGLVRTMDRARSIIAILTTPDMESRCSALLDSLASTLHWRYASMLSETEMNRYIQEL